ncbi:MAG: YCF48-related protein [Bacteroidota bacterium]|jgi:photosystem II stability/assembly factor-like uncharacterized protein
MRFLLCVLVLFCIYKNAISQSNWTAHQTNSTAPLLSAVINTPSFWVVTDTNGVIQTTSNSGNSWVTRNSGTQVALHDIVNPILPNFVCVGDSGVIRRSTDNGTTWSAITSGTTNNLRSLHFSTGVGGLAVGYSGTILRTTNGGISWVNNSLTTTAHLEAVVQVSSSLAFAVGHQGTILKSNDGGTSWQNIQSSISSENFHAVDFWNAHVGICAGTNGALLVTLDGGINWTIASGFTTGTIESVKFKDINTVFCSTSNGELFYSSNKGMNWVALSSFPQSNFDISFYYSGNLVIPSANGIIYSNIYHDWYSSGIPGSYSASFINDSTGICKGSNSVLYYTNNGRSWDTLINNVVGGYFVAMTPDSSIHISYLNSVHTTRDLGQTWTNVTLGNLSSSLGEIVFPEDSVGFFAGDALYRTLDGGYTWNATNSTFSNLGRIEFFNRDTGYFVNGSVLYYTDNGGTTVQPILSGCNRFHFANKNFGTGFLYNSIYASDVWLTKNGGRSFIKLTTPSIYYSISDVHFVDSLTGYISGTGSQSTQFLIIHKTTDGGQTWTLQSFQNAVSNTQRFFFASEKFGVLTGVQDVLTNYTTDQSIFNNPSYIPSNFVRSIGPGYDWIIQSNVPNESYWQKSATKKNGNLLISGFYRNFLSWGPYIYNYSLDTNYQFIADVNSSGFPASLKVFKTGTNTLPVSCMGVDGSGYIYMCGSFSQFIIVDSITYTATNGTYWIKVDSLFNVIHFQLLDTSQNVNTAKVLNMSVDADGNSYLLLNYSYNYTLQNHTFTMPSTVGFVKLDSTGVLQWANQCDNPNSIQNADIAFANDSSLWISGTVTPDMSIDGDTIPIPGSTKNFIGRLDPQSGALYWLKGYGINTNNFGIVKPASIAPHPDGSLYFCGDINTSQPARFDSLLWSNQAEGTRRTYIGEIDVNGTIKRVKTVQTMSFPDIAIDSNGKLYLSGINPYRIDDTLVLASPQHGLFYSIIRYNSEFKSEWLNTIHFTGDVNQLSYSKIALFDTSLVYNVMLTGSVSYTIQGIGSVGPPNGPINFGTAYKLTVGPYNPVSVNNESSEENSALFTLSPNPSSATIYLTLTNMRITDNMSYSIIDLTGKTIIESQQIGKIQTSIDVSCFSSGVYFIQVKSDSQASVLKLIKQ